MRFEGSKLKFPRFLRYLQKNISPQNSQIKAEIKLRTFLKKLINLLKSDGKKISPLPIVFGIAD